MGTNAEVTLTANSLPGGFCHQDWQSTLNAFVSAMSGELPGTFSTFSVGASEPAAEDQDKPWLNTSNDSTGGWKKYDSSEGWIRAEPLSPPPGTIVDWYGDDTQIPTLDGGTSTNPFWRICDGTNSTPDLRGRVTLGTGTGTSLTARSLSDTGGAESVDIKAAVEHCHYIGRFRGTAGETGDDLFVKLSGDDSDSTADHRGVPGNGSDPVTTNPNATYTGPWAETSEVKDLPLDGDDKDLIATMPPFYALHKIMRTARLY